LRLIEALALQALLADAQGQREIALGLLEQAVTLAEPGGFVRDFVDLGPPMAGLLSRLRDTGLAGRSDALPYVDRILAAFGPGTDHGQPATTGATTSPSPPLVLRKAEELIEPLTRRESEVLALLAQRLTYKEIGALLFIAPSTVSQHTVRIYQKLQVNNRRQALVKAQALGILPRQ